MVNLQKCASLQKKCFFLTDWALLNNFYSYFSFRFSTDPGDTIEMDDLDVFTLPDLEQYNVRPSIL